MTGYCICYASALWTTNRNRWEPKEEMRIERRIVPNKRFNTDAQQPRLSGALRAG